MSENFFTWSETGVSWGDEAVWYQAQPLYQFSLHCDFPRPISPMLFEAHKPEMPGDARWPGRCRWPGHCVARALRCEHAVVGVNSVHALA